MHSTTEAVKLPTRYAITECFPLQPGKKPGKKIFKIGASRAWYDFIFRMWDTLILYCTRANVTECLLPGFKHASVLGNHSDFLQAQILRIFMLKSSLERNLHLVNLYLKSFTSPTHEKHRCQTSHQRYKKLASRRKVTKIVAWGRHRFTFVFKQQP